MPALILYLLKVNIALVLFYLAYHFVLRRLTFYHLNRLFLVFGVLFSILHPFIELSVLLSQHEELAVIQTYAAIPAWAPTPTAMPEQTTAIDYWLIPVVLFWLGTVVMAGRLILQFLSLSALHRASEPASYQGIDFRKISGIREAFSFWQTIYLNPAQHKEDELKSILRHELIHVKGWHTLDVLLAELSTMLYWFNPGGWLMKKAMKENLEFIADQHVMSAGTDRKAYQYLLLKAAGTSEPQLANQFNFPSLKRRIVMMNKKKSSLMHVARYAVLVPLIVTPILLIACSENDADMISPPVPQPQVYSVDVEDEIPDVEIYAPDASTAPEDYKNFLKRNPEVKHVSWEVEHVGRIHEVTKGIAQRSIVIELNSGDSDMYDLDDEKSVSAAEAKYGELPALPAPPVPSKQELPPSTSRIDNPIGFPDPAGRNKEFLKRNPAVKSISWVASRNNREVEGFVIHLQSGGFETYHLSNGSDTAAAKSKYGELPALPPPPPPVRSDIPVYIPDASNIHEDHSAFLKRNPEVKQLGWMIGDSFGRKVRMLVVYLKSGDTETYDLDHDYNMDMAESKYGTLPALPPPPPPVRIEN
ncbi:hypothetical protein DXT99_10900 [Pontibacter diazotrophicus]|uniref:Peptidase M56 domain-containing protein n=1 Tax=Pontibacter diazotrophicus TaxID=1400979 RepID=A0A3D8LCM6_9BACT|nr:M56 family metallopeptidase [Pontibacter diazotrophicus]RDV15167.1 hypothetical protein DXT99_10900 [Pontibacter diazotrophicus]